MKERLDSEVLKHKSSDAVDENNLDPIMVAHRYKDPTISLICALFSYGNVKQIVKFLNSLDFSLLNESDEKIRESLSQHYYRFQKSEDIIALFITLKKLNKESTLETVFKRAYDENKSVIDGVNACIFRLRELSSHSSKGYNFLLGKVTNKTKGAGALKRWMMFLRWMVREDNIDMGLWNGISKADLIMPLDTHTYKIGLSWGLLKRKTYDLEAAIELTNSLKKFDKEDPLKYDFAIYRLGQAKVV